MIDQTTIENALITWARLATFGLVATERVYLGDQDTIETQLQPRVVLMLRDLTPQGTDEISETFDATAPAGEEFKVEARGQRTLEVSLQTFAPKTTGVSNTALAIASALQSNLSLPGVRASFNASGFGVLEVRAVIRLPRVVSGKHEDSALLELVLSVTSKASERVGYFDRVEFNEAPKWWWPMGADDSPAVMRDHGMSAARTPLRVKQHKGFPKIVDGRDGRKARQFSRADFDQVGLTVDGVARSEIAMRDAEAFAVREWTFGAWLRREPSHPDAVGSVLTRIWSIRGGAELLVRDVDHVALPGAIGMCNVYWNATTGQMYARNQYGIDDVSYSASVAGFTFTMPVGEWHHIVVRKQNNAPGSASEVTYVLFVDGAINQSVTPVNGKNYNPIVVKRVAPPDDPELATMTIGGASGQGTYSGRTLYGIDATMQDVRVYDRRLTEDQIARWFSAVAP